MRRVRIVQRTLTAELIARPDPRLTKLVKRAVPPHGREHAVTGAWVIGVHYLPQLVAALTAAGYDVSAEKITRQAGPA